MCNEQKGQRCPFVTAVVVAAGNSTRMGGKCSKQLLDLCGRPVIAHTLAAFEQAESIQNVVIVCRREDGAAMRDAADRFAFRKVCAIVPGGSTRQQSVFSGIAAAAEQTDYYAIHDGARALVTPLEINAAVEDAFRYQAAAAAVPVKDTIKRVDSGCFVADTPDRSFLWTVQTPQVFEKRLYLSAIRKAREQAADYTDDCQLVEHLGIKVHLCMGSYGNIKITTADDIALAERILQLRNH